MARVTSTAARVIAAPAATVRAALADYEQVRPRILTAEFSNYGVESGGFGGVEAVVLEIRLVHGLGELPQHRVGELEAAQDGLERALLPPLVHLVAERRAPAELGAVPQAIARRAASHSRRTRLGAR